MTTRFKETQEANPIWKWKTKENTNFNDINKNIIAYINTLEPNYQDMILGTSGRDGKHSKNSRHYTGNAVDLRYIPELYKRIERDPIRKKYGLTLIDPFHGTAPHIHLSFGEGNENKLDVWKDYNPNEQHIETKNDKQYTDIPSIENNSYIPFQNESISVPTQQPFITETQNTQINENTQAREKLLAKQQEKLDIINFINKTPMFEYIERNRNI